MHLVMQFDSAPATVDFTQATRTSRPYEVECDAQAYADAVAEIARAPEVELRGAFEKMYALTEGRAEASPPLEGAYAITGIKLVTREELPLGARITIAHRATELLSIPMAWFPFNAKLKGEEAKPSLRFDAPLRDCPRCVNWKTGEPIDCHCRVVVRQLPLDVSRDAPLLWRGSCGAPLSVTIDNCEKLHEYSPQISVAYALVASEMPQKLTRPLRTLSFAESALTETKFVGALDSALPCERIVFAAYNPRHQSRLPQAAHCSRVSIGGLLSMSDVVLREGAQSEVVAIDFGAPLKLAEKAITIEFEGDKNPEFTALPLPPNLMDSPFLVDGSSLADTVRRMQRETGDLLAEQNDAMAVQEYQPTASRQSAEEEVAVPLGYAVRPKLILRTCSTHVETLSIDLDAGSITGSGGKSAEPSISSMEDEASSSWWSVFG